jgi:ankyrin repeat protein/mono/diheme cytochrome c family protein
MKVLPRVVFVACCAAILPSPFLLSPTAAQQSARVDYARDIQPLFRANCYSCHGPSSQNGGLRLDRRRDAMPNRVGANGARIVPGDSAASRVYLRVAGSGAGLQMPPSGALSADAIATIKTWIDQGAEWPDELSGEIPSAPQDPHVMRLIEALRSGDSASFERVLRANPAAAKTVGSGGDTALMHAALYGDIKAVRSLLDGGADPNARNDAGATALLWAVDDVDISRLLLDRGANPNVRSADGRTPLFVAAGRFGASDIVSLLIDRGASVKEPELLGRAAAAGDPALMTVLIDHGADRTASERDIADAIRSRCSRCVEMLVELSRSALNAALFQAARIGDSSSVRILLDRGAEPSTAALERAAAVETAPLEAVTLLLKRGGRINEALDEALRHGETAVVTILRAAGATATPRPVPEVKRRAASRSARAAVEAAFPLIEHADAVFLKKAACVSCHNNSLFQMTIATLRDRGLRRGGPTVEAQRRLGAAYIETWRDRVLQDIPLPGSVDTTGYTLAGLAAVGHPPDAATDALARFLLRRQAADGGWRIGSHRPPVESSDVEATALAVRALQTYAPKPQRARYSEAVRRASAWLTTARPLTTEDHVYKVLGLVWTRRSDVSIRDAARQLIALQRADGGWGQLPTLTSDAYASGQALVALAEAGETRTDTPFRNGIRFLLSQQLADGSWFVQSRARPSQPYFDSEFPHGTDQFISAAATNWAVMALAHAAAN